MTRIGIANGATPVERIRFMKAAAKLGVDINKPAQRKHFFTTAAGTHALCSALLALGHGWTFADNGDVYVTLAKAKP